ncbi:MAG: MFS transporter [Candidatus Acidiferrales bacterium]
MAAPSTPPVTNTPAGRIAFSSRAFTLFIIARWCVVIGVEMQSVAVGWQVYDITKRPLDLGLVGLAQFLPGILLFLVSGHAADRFNRRKLLLACYAGYALCSGLLLTIALHGTRSVNLIYAVMVLLGVVRSFTGPTGRAILPQLVPEEHFPNAVAWNANAFQSATILGPALGGLVYAFFRGPSAVYAGAMTVAAAAFISILRIDLSPRSIPRDPVNLKTVLAGVRYIRSHKLILGSISLDLFAVLLGGAVALLPVYAREVLQTGPWGLGLLRCAPGAGAAVMSVFLAYRPLRRRAGATMLWCVAGYGVFTVVFGLSRSFAISLAALFLVGAADMVSVIVRGILIQIATPDEMRGRVNAVDMVFIGASNQFGEFESGLTASWFGTVPAVVIGGVGAIVVTALWSWKFSELRRADSLTV